jgi:hypothetical protein
MYIYIHVEVEIQAGESYIWRSQWLRGLRHEISWLARTLGSWFQIPLKARMSVCAFILCCPMCR